MANSITRDGVEFAGAMEVRFFDVDITNYDSDGSGDGEAFSPSDAGMQRFQNVVCTVKPNAGSGATTALNAVAQYDYANESIRLYHSGGADGEMAEASSNADEGAVVRVMAIGR